MASPLYFFPGVAPDELATAGGLVAEVLTQVDLDRTLAGVRRENCTLAEIAGKGPGGRSGTILCPLPADKRVPVRAGFYPEFQDWTEFRTEGDGSGVWLGIDREHPPGPADLARARMMPGYEVDLGDNRGRWTVPVVRDPHGGSGLPARWTYAGRTARTSIRAEYLALWESWGPVAALFFDPEGPPELAMPVQDALDRCLAVLALNYRVGPHEQCVLDLVGPDNWEIILAASVDLPAYRDVWQRVQAERVQKKTEKAAGGSASPGSGAGASPDSTPAGPVGTACAASGATWHGDVEY